MASSDDNMDETMKYKVGKVLDVHPNKNKQEVLLVLEYYSFDVDTTVNAYTEGNIPDKLKISYSSNSVRTNNKNKRKKKKNKKAGLSGTMQSNDGVASESATSSVVKTSDNEEEEYEVSPNIQVHDSQPLSNVSERIGEPVQSNNSSSQNGDLNKSHYKFSPTKPKTQNPLRNSEDSIKNKSPEHDNDHGNQVLGNTLRDDTSSANKSTGSGNASPKKTHEFTKPYPKNRHRSSGSFSQSRTTSMSEETSSQASVTSSAPAGQGKINLEKSMKDLSRQTVALSRVNNILEEELEGSYKRLKNAAAEIQKLLEERTHCLEQEMDKVKKDARALLSQRKEIAAELKQRAERSSSFTETELKELRDDIKHFVVERKYDEELGKTLRFTWTRDSLLDQIRDFGEVTHVKNSYSQRRQSVSSVASSTCMTSSVIESSNDRHISNLTGSKESSGEGNSSNNQTSDARPNNNQTFPSSRSRIFFSSTRPYHGPDYGGGNTGPNPNSASGHGGGATGGGMGQTRPSYRNYQHQQPRGRGHFSEGRGGRGRGYYKQPHYNNQRYSNNANQQDSDETGNRRPPPRRGGRNHRFQNHNQGRSYQHNNSNNNINVNAAANNNPAANDTPKEVHIIGDKAPEASNTTLVNGFVNH